MCIIFKILAVPFVVVLAVLWAMLFFVGQAMGGIVFAVIAFLISPVGILTTAVLADIRPIISDSAKTVQIKYGYTKKHEI